MEVIPAIDVLGGRVVRLVEGDYDRATAYRVGPVDLAGRWMAEGASRLHLVDLDGARSGRRSDDVLADVASVGMRVQAGGGVRSVESARAALAVGADRVVVGTVAVQDASLLALMVAELGPSRLVAAIDVRHGRAHGAGWRDRGVAVDRVLTGVLAAGVRCLLVTAIARDGTLAGPDLGLLGDVKRAAPRCELIASGGVGSLADIDALADAGVDGVVIGRALLDRAFSLSDAIDAAGR